MAASQSEHKTRIWRRAGAKGSKAADRSNLGIIEMQRRRGYRFFLGSMPRGQCEPYATERGDAKSRTKK